MTLMDVSLRVGWGIPSRKYVPWSEKWEVNLGPHRGLGHGFWSDLSSWKEKVTVISLLWCNEETLGIRLSSIPGAENREATTALLFQGQPYTTRMLFTGWQPRMLGRKKKSSLLPPPTHPHMLFLTSRRTEVITQDGPLCNTHINTFS